MREAGREGGARRGSKQRMEARDSTKAGVETWGWVGWTNRRREVDTRRGRDTRTHRGEARDKKRWRKRKRRSEKQHALTQVGVICSMSRPSCFFSSFFLFAARRVRASAKAPDVTAIQGAGGTRRGQRWQQQQQQRHFVRGCSRGEGWGKVERGAAVQTHTSTHVEAHARTAPRREKDSVVCCSHPTSVTRSRTHTQGVNHRRTGSDEQTRPHTHAREENVNNVRQQ